ncbi:MAG: intracellular septation protein [Thermoproteota archaeon]|jgi:intracellular septation protein
MRGSKGFFLISFLPALAYWFLEENYSIQIALTGGILLGVLEMVLEKIFTKQIHQLSKINFILIVGLGFISLLANEGIWFKLQPFFNGLIMGGIFLTSSLKGKSYFYEIMQGMNNQAPPKYIIINLEKHMAVFMMVYGSFMAYVAFNFTTQRWLFYKTAGLYIAFFLFSIVEMIFMRRAIKKHFEREMFLKVNSNR